MAQFSNLVKCLEQEQGRSSGVGNMDWRQWQNVAQSNDLSNVWNRQTPAWTRPGDQRPGYNNQGYNTQGNSGGQQPRPGVHPEDWNNRQPGTGAGYPGNNNMNWPQNQDGGNTRDRDRDRDGDRRRKERRRNRNQNRRKDPNNDRQQNNEAGLVLPFKNDLIS